MKLISKIAILLVVLLAFLQGFGFLFGLLEGLSYRPRCSFQQHYVYFMPTEPVACFFGVWLVSE